jgi:hypothetical protein
MDHGCVNPWIALDVATDPVAHSRKLRDIHERTVTGCQDDVADVRAVVAASWRRSLAAGVAPDAPGAPVTLSEDELQAARARSSLTPAVAAIMATLSSLDTEARHVVAISDASANLLWVSGDPHAIERARKMRFQEGAAWSESAAGTNAVGTAAAVDHPIQIFSAEHLMAAVHEWTCSAAPVHHPATGELIGVIDLTAALRTAHPHTLSLAALAAQSAENTLLVRELERVAALRARWESAIAGRRTPNVLLDVSGRPLATFGVAEPLPQPLAEPLPSMSDGAVTLADGRAADLQRLPGGGAILWLRRSGATSAPRIRLRLLGAGATARLANGPAEHGLRSLELIGLLAMHPDGLTAEQLALALYGESGKAVTIRAQIHRVRTRLGGRAITTQPYRLAIPVDADWLEVKRLVAGGRPHRALEAYPGPLLPASDAPAIVDERALLGESLRRSILTTADPELLWRWLSHPAGADDLAAARTLVNVLPAGDPRRAAATAAAAAAARRTAAVPETEARPTGWPQRLATVVQPPRA